MANESNVFFGPPRFGINDDWDIYEEVLKHFFVANPSIVDARKAAILLTAVSTDVYKIIKNAAFPDTPDKKSFDELCVLCKKQFSPIVSVFAERCRFYEARQLDGESMTEWVNRVKKLSMQCDFGAFMSLALRDKFISGMCKGPVFERVCKMKKDSTLSECIDAALLREMTLKEKSVLRDCNKLNTHQSRPKHVGASSRENSDSAAR